jgi:hypothetical protein
MKKISSPQTSRFHQYGMKDFPVTSTGDSPGQDCQKSRAGSAVDIAPFTPFATSSKKRKYRFIEGLYCPEGGAKSRLA